MKYIKSLLKGLSFKLNAGSQRKRYYPNMDEEFFEHIRKAIAEINHKGEMVYEIDN